MIYAAIARVNFQQNIPQGKDLSQYLSLSDQDDLNNLFEIRDRIRMLASRQLLQNLFHHIYPGKCSVLSLKKDTKGKPTIDGLKSVSISHSWEYVAVAFNSICEIGIDIQRHEGIPISDLESILNENEKQELCQIPKGKQISWLFDQWSKKEALLKAEGLGLSIDPINVLTEGQCGKIMDKNKLWYFLPCPQIHSYSIELCTARKGEQVTWYALKEEKLVYLELGNPI